MYIGLLKGHHSDVIYNEVIKLLFANLIINNRKFVIL